MQHNLFTPLTKIFEGEGSKLHASLGVAMLATLCFAQVITFFIKVLDNINDEAS